MNTTKNRINWIDISKFIGIMFVMFSHCELCPDYLRVFFSPFYLTIFYFCSGYLYKTNVSFKETILKKAKQLVLPWFIYSNLNIILSNIKSFKYHHNDFVTELFRNLLQIRYYDERLWFLPALFVGYIPFYFIEKYYRKHTNKTNHILLFCFFLTLLRKMYKALVNPEIFPWKLTSLPWHIDYIPTVLFFMVLGMIFKYEYEENFNKHNTFVFRIVLSIVYIVYIYTLNQYDLSNMFFLDCILDNLRHILGILFILSWSKVIRANNYMLYIGSNTLFYFCSHNKMVTLLEVILKNLLKTNYEFILSNNLLSTFVCFVLTILVSVILIPITKIVNKYFAWTLGK